SVVTMAADEGPAYGVALLAAVGAGEYKDVVEACDATVKTTSETKPNAAARKQYDAAFPLYQKLYRSLREDFRAIAKLST
ncbi:MAG TPA: xylulokinase, partial [Lacipirellulaceae bacterium]